MPSFDHCLALLEIRDGGVVRINISYKGRAKVGHPLVECSRAVDQDGAGVMNLADCGAKVFKCSLSYPIHTAFNPVIGIKTHAERHLVVVCVDTDLCCG